METRGREGAWKEPGGGMGLQSGDGQGKPHGESAEGEKKPVRQVCSSSSQGPTVEGAAQEGLGLSRRKPGKCGRWGGGLGFK